MRQSTDSFNGRILTLHSEVNIQSRQISTSNNFIYKQWEQIYISGGKSIIDHKAAVLGVNLNPQTIICDFETALIPAIQGYFPNTRVQGCYFHFCQAVHRKVGELGLKTQYRQHEETRRKIRMLLATAFLPVPHVNTGVSLLEAGTTGTLAALFQYFRQEWMTGRITTWNNRLNRKAGKSHNGFYELLELLIAEQGVMDTLIQQVLSGNVTVGDLRRVAQYTGEYTNGRRTLEQFLEALMYKPVDPSAPPDDPVADYMNILGMIFSMCGLMMRLKWCAWVALYCSFVSFSNSKITDDAKQIVSSFMLSISSVVMCYLQNPTPINYAL
ncbi:Protein Asterix [Trichinella britovi]|uniref:Protein Asterix n=1 Tax=Trichinella britovi TaxID=45882 RepID=A0A0V1CZX8_TRIBR|nr:Protein Asterix [Trichinella britovi]